MLARMEAQTVRRIAVILVVLFSSAPAAGSLYSRDLDCETQGSPRARDICTAVEHGLEWTWKGHAIISPSFRATTKTTAGVFCTLTIGPNDTPTLVQMALDTNYRKNTQEALINNAAGNLLKLLGHRALDQFPDPSTFPDGVRRSAAKHLREEVRLSITGATNIYNPTHPHYVLRDGCP
ncbi:MAG: hypothetical protein OEU46_14995 [Alphaproteobacteria bacterium]|nr:hypothetical protein [Alphaproteobacteria bacterium]